MKTENKIQSSLTYSKIEDLNIKNNNEEENTRSGTVTKIRRLDEEILPISTPDINDDET
jgi:hypothetical protein